ncbi:MAG: YchJ family metal-binding protein [Pseudomonadales bacterium]
MASQQPLCPCGSLRPRAACCEPIIAGSERAADAQALMRARYTAFATGNEAFLLASWHPTTRPRAIEFDPRQRWLGLKILRHEAGTDADRNAVVEFVARFKIAGSGYRLHEVSRFERGNDGWLYIDGIRGATDSSLRG